MEDINFDDFQRIDLRVAKVIAAEKIEDSEKLLKLEIDLGKEKRQLVAGIGQFYSPEELMRREIVVVANLELKKIKGVESQGMLLAADIGGKPILLKPDEEVPPGTKIR